MVVHEVRKSLWLQTNLASLLDLADLDVQVILFEKLCLSHRRLILMAACPWSTILPFRLAIHERTDDLEFQGYQAFHSAYFTHYQVVPVILVDQEVLTDRHNFRLLADSMKLMVIGLHRPLF